MNITGPAQRAVDTTLARLDVRLRDQVAATVVGYRDRNGWPTAHIALSRPRHLVCPRCFKPLKAAAEAERINPETGEHENPRRRGIVRHICGAENPYAIACAQIELTTGADWPSVVARLLSLLDQQVRLG